MIDKSLLTSMLRFSMVLATDTCILRHNLHTYSCKLVFAVKEEESLVKKLVFILCCIVLNGGCREHMEIFPPLKNEALLTDKLTISQMHQDIDSFVLGMQTRHPDFNAYADVEAIYKRALQLKKEINRPMLRTEFYRYIGQLTHLFNDGHALLLWPYQEYKGVKSSGRLLFPFAVTLSDNNKLLIKHDYTDGNKVIKAGDELISINNQPSSDIMAHLQQFAGGETTSLRYQFVAERFTLMLWAVMAGIDNFEVKIQRGQATQTITLNAKTKWQEQVKQQAMAHYYRPLEGSVGFLYLAHFDIEPDEFEQFIDETFAQIKRENTQHLIIDIRDNPGGNTDTVSYLSRYLANTPFKLVSSIEEKLNKDNRGLFGYRGQEGDMLKQVWQNLEHPINNENGFSGRSYLLIGPKTYSAAIVLATTLKDNNFSTLIGRETGGFANQSGQLNLFSLPHSELRAAVATRLLVRPSGKMDKQGVKPHYVTSKTQESVRNSRDNDIELAMQLIEQAKGN